MAFSLLPFFIFIYQSHAAAAADAAAAIFVIAAAFHFSPLLFAAIFATISRRHAD